VTARMADCGEGAESCPCGYAGLDPHCHLCHSTPPSSRDLLAHLEVEHADVWTRLQRWPDGAPVVVDTTLDPADFGSDQA
jgi:hypothetical protein